MSAKPDNKYVKYTPYERFMVGMYRDIDKEIKKALGKLGREGTTPSCEKGCYLCCRQQIPVVIVEAHALAQYINKNFSDKQKNELRKRMADWFAWVRDELPKYGNTTEAEMAAFYDHSPFCPLLVDGECSAYPVRPYACRTHFVSTGLDNCRSHLAVKSAPDEPILLAVINATKPFAMSIRRSVEANGMDFDQSLVLLPQGLAIEMGWGDLLP